MNNDCTLYKTMDYLAKKWVILILFELWKGEGEVKRFTELKDAVTGITPKVLSDRLKELEREGLVVKYIETKSFPMRSEYKLTEAGMELMEAVRQIKSWALKWQISNEICLLQDCRNCKL